MADLDVEVLSQHEAGVDIEVEETGSSFEENAYLKAKAACEASGCPAVADDSGLEVEVLNGEPGIYSARYGGAKCSSDEDRLNYLLKNMESLEQRRAKFVSCIVCVFPGGDTIQAMGEFQGEILKAPRGTGGFGYDPIFYVPEYGMTAAEMAPEQKNAISHRGKALRDFKERLREYNADK